VATPHASRCGAWGLGPVVASQACSASQADPVDGYGSSRARSLARAWPMRRDAVEIALSGPWCCVHCVRRVTCVARLAASHRDGFYPNGVKTDLSAVAFEPSGMLIKVQDPDS
jgi:hypothetical protein